MRTRLLHQGPVTVREHRCAAGPGDAAFEEQHDGYCIAVVRSGGFTYRHCGRTFEMAPGSVLVGHPGDAFVCSHEHVRGDACLSFHLDREVAEAACRGLKAFEAGAAPALPGLAIAGVRALAAAGVQDPLALEEAGLDLAAAFARLVQDDGRAECEPSAADRRRALEAALWLEANCSEAIDLGRAAAAVGLSPFHFLRIFRRVFGQTPHQYLVSCRLRLAARRLALEPEAAVSALAYESGFGDLSNFIRSFRAAAGVSPGRWRAAVLSRRPSQPSATSPAWDRARRRR